MTREEALKKVRQMSLPKETMEILEALAPELAESEDERMLREIKRYIKEQGDKPTGLPNGTVAVADMITWLEKQKECVSNNFDDVWNEEDCEEIIAEGQKLTSRFKELLKEVCHAWYDRGAKLEKQKEQKEQKPVPPLPPFDEMTPEDKMNHPLYLEGFDMGRDVQKVFDEQKPAEWSDTKELVFKDICNHLEVEGYSGWVVLLNALRNGEFQPKQEWSEEDEEILKLLILNIGRYMYFGGMSSERILSFLKSLRPQQRQEWSEEEKEILDSILSHYVLIDKPIDANGIPKEKYISLIKSIRFDTYKNCNSHWKPSEEQMKALNEIVNILAESPFLHQNDYLFNILNGLREELKKLL